MKSIFFTSLVVVLFICGKPLTPLPHTNAKIVEYVKSVIGKQVDRGECWDLANRALSYANCTWDGKYEYGELINFKKDKVLPGDIIQFSNVYVKYEKAGGVYVETYPHHTAIVYEELDGKNNFRIAHQNNGFTGRKVGISELNFDNITKGKIYIYRPIAK